MCEVIELFDGSFAVKLEDGWVAFGIPYRKIADEICLMCNQALGVAAVAGA